MAGSESLAQGVARRRAILRFVKAYLKREQHPPSVQEITDGIGLASKTATRHHLKRLRAEGYVDWTDGKYRSLTLTNDGRYPPRFAPSTWRDKADEDLTSDDLDAMAAEGEPVRVVGPHVMTVACADCGAVAVRVPTSLQPDQTMLANPTMVDTVLGLFDVDALLEAACRCRRWRRAARPAGPA